MRTLVLVHHSISGMGPVSWHLVMITTKAAAIVIWAKAASRSHIASFKPMLSRTMAW